LAELSTTEASEQATLPLSKDTLRATESKWYRWRRNGKDLIAYLLDSEIHTYAFSVAANAILSFIPFCVLLYTLAYRVFNSPTMVRVVDEMVNYFLPTHTHEQDWLTRNMLAYSIRSSAGGVQIISLIMILIACTGIFLPLEVALNQAWGVTKSRNYLFNQVVALGLALLMVLLGVGSIYLNLGAQSILSFIFVHPTWYSFIQNICNFIYNCLSYGWLAISTGVASIVFFFSIYWLLPNRRVPWRHVLRTSIVTGIVWLLSKMIFTAVLPHLHFEDLYGPFFVTVGLLFWAYISGLILFAGAQFSVSRWGGEKK
jgi:membrane protein/epoxyqueuosine reductase